MEIAAQQIAITSGYKQTEVGIIPQGWNVKQLKQISPSQSVGLVVNPSSYFADDGTVPMLVGSNIRENRIDWEPAKKISNASNRVLPASQLNAGDLVTVRVGEPGTTAVVPPELNGCNCASMMIVRQHKSFNSLWLSYVMNSRIGLSQVEHVQYGTAQKQFNISDAINFIYPVPPLAEQEAIAGALSDVDALIGALDKLIVKKRDLKQAAMQQLLTGKQRLHGFHGEWEKIPLNKLTQIPITDGPHLTPQFLQDGIPFLSVNNLVNNKIDLSDLRFISKRDHEEFSKKCKPQKNDILLGKAASVGVAAVVDVDFEFNIWSPIALIRLCDKYVPRFIYYLFQSRSVMSQIKLLTNSSSQGNLGMGEIGKLEFVVPSKEEQAAIVTILSDMDAEIAALEQRRDKTRALKQGMMQELLTGKTRLI